MRDLLAVLSCSGDPGPRQVRGNPVPPQHRNGMRDLSQAPGGIACGAGSARCRTRSGRINPASCSRWIAVPTWPKRRTRSVSSVAPCRTFRISIDRKWPKVSPCSFAKDPCQCGRHPSVVRPWCIPARRFRRRDGQRGIADRHVHRTQASPRARCARRLPSGDTDPPHGDPHADRCGKES